MKDVSKNIQGISVVITTHDRYAYLLEAIQSVVKQSLKPTQIIVVDDGTPVPIERQFKKDGFVLDEIELTVIRIDDKGPSAARNAGFKGCSGDLIAFLDDDDLWDFNYLEKCVSFLQGENADCVVTWLTCFNGKERWPGKKFPENYQSLDLYDKNHGFIGSNFIIRRNCYQLMSGFDELLLGSEDKDFLIRMVAQNISIAVMPEPLVLYRIHPKSQASGKSNFHFMQVYGKYEFYKKHSINMPRITRWRLKSQSSYFLFRGARQKSERLKGFLDFVLSIPLALLAILINKKNRKHSL
jgi:GalNAc5-diNAcBac-PP-undecaprenol beta-1,3-glucosyltransferase